MILDGIVSIILVHWHWKVFLNIEYWWYLDIPNLRNVKLPVILVVDNGRKMPECSFQKVQSKSISSIVWFDLISFIDVSSILADRIEINSNDNFELFCDMLLIRNISIKCLFVCFKPILNPNSWFYYYQNINPDCLIMLFSWPFLQWYWIRIDVSINQPFISKMIMLFITNDTSIIYWAFTNDDDCNLPIITK